jgi:hypothetical protein
MFRPQAGLGPPISTDYLWAFLAVIVVAHALGKSGAWKRLSPRVPAPVTGLGHGVTLTLALMLAAGSGRAFVYFQF